MRNPQSLARIAPAMLLMMTGKKPQVKLKNQNGESESVRRFFVCIIFHAALFVSRSKKMFRKPLNFTRHFFARAIRQSGIILFALIALNFFSAPDGLAQSAASQENSSPKRVLMIFNEGKDVPGSILLEEALRTEMQKGGTNQIEFLAEYLDASHFSDKQHFRVFQDYLGKKYAGQNLDLIVSFPSRDYRLAGDLPKALFPKVPVVFVAINELEMPQSLGKRGVTGIVQRFDIRGTLGLIMRLQPDTRRVVVIGGVSDVDRATLGRIAEASHALEGIEFHFWTNRPMAELPATVNSLREGTVVLLSTVLNDVNGQTYYMAQLAQLLAPSASVPVYAIGSSAIGVGALGGSVVNTEDLGTQTGQLALRVMGGTKPESLPIEVATKGTPMVDWRALQRWRIKEGRVPSGAVIRYRPETLWDEHKDLILFSLAVFLAQAVTIGGLLAQRSQRRSAEAVILNQRTELAHVTRVATMGQLTSALAHELNQPLGAILRNAEAAEMFLQKENPDLEEIRAILADIRKDDQRAGNVIERMRSLLKRRSLELKSLNLAELLNETVKLAQSDARVRQVSLILQIPPELPSVRGDRVHLQQVLLNLILNGMDAMAGVAKFQRVLTLNAKIAKDGNVEVSVTDRGIGIAPDKIDSLFEPFFTTKPNGMGMGLAISQTIIEAHGGEIWGGNIFPRGAVFIFTLPADDN
jgi:signal transduction histidine kinase